MTRSVHEVPSSLSVARVEPGPHAPDVDRGDPPEPPLRGDRGIIILVEHDRSRLQQLDEILRKRGYTVVSMTRALTHLARLARALRPCAILLAWGSEGIDDFVRELNGDTCYVHAMVPILVFSRTGGTCPPGTLEHATDADLVSSIERFSALVAGALYKAIDDDDMLKIDATELRLLAAIAQRDDESRVVYADWLEQRGETARAEFLRALELLVTTTADDPLFRERSDRMRELSAAMNARWRYKVVLPLITGAKPLPG
jgi:uncharacterized protein (TIGR02996 family)